MNDQSCCTLTCYNERRGTESCFIWIIDLPISHQVLPSVKLLIRWVSWDISRLGHHKWHLKTVTLMMRFQVLHCLILWNLYFLLQYHVFLEHTDPTYEFCGIKRTWETCHWCKVLLSLLLWSVPNESRVLTASFMSFMVMLFGNLTGTGRWCSLLMGHRAGTHWQVSLHFSITINLLSNVSFK